MPQLNCIELWQQEYLSSCHAPDTRAWGFTSRCRIQPNFTFFIKIRHTSFVPLSIFALTIQMHLTMPGCYRPYSLHLPWCKAAGVRLDRTETKAPFYSPGSPDCSFPAWGQALLLCLLGEGMAISGLPARDNAISVSKSHRPFTGCYLQHLLFYYKSFLIF